MNNLKHTSESKAVFDTFSEFLAAVFEEKEQYAYVAVAERRCFNLVNYFFPAARNIYSDNGLLLCYQELAEAYRSNGSFPRILVVDDLAIHGRSIGKFLWQLESAIRYVLKPETEEAAERLRYQLIDAVDIRVFARSKSPMLIRDGYLMKMRCDHSLFGVQIRELTDQLSRLVSHCGIANTCFVFSMNWPDEAVPTEERFGDWTKALWNHNNRHLCAYIRPVPSKIKGKAQRISTVRYYEDAGSNPLVTSYTIFGNLPLGTVRENTGICSGLRKVCLELCERLPETMYSNLRHILREENPYVQQARGQLICLIISMLDFLEFCRDVGASFRPEVLTENSDLVKIAANFGSSFDNLGKPYIKTELERILLDKPLRRNLQEILYRGLEEFSEPLPFIESVPASAEDRCRDINGIARSFFYEVGMRSEQDSCKYAETPYLFPADEFDKYEPDQSEEGLPGKGGVVSFDEYLREMRRSSVSDMESLATYLILLDQGYIGGRLYSSDKDIYPLIKAGERAMFYLPQKLSLFLPALAQVEACASLVSMTRREAVLAFVEKMGYHGSSPVVSGKLKDLQKNVRVYTDKLYKCGQTYGGWCFSRLVRQEDSHLEAAQKDFLNQANSFLYTK